MSEPLAIVAGAGALPWEAAAAIAPRRPVIVLAIADEADPGPDGLDVHVVAPGQLGRIRKLMLAHGCRDVLFLGAVRRRPDFRTVLGDWETMKLVPRIVRAAVGGDDTIVRNLLALVEEEGFRIVSVAEAVPELLAPAGQMTRRGPTAAQAEDIALGRRFLDAAAAFDIGQAVAVAEGRIIAVEAAEGTDAMLERCAAVRAAGRVRAANGAGALVKRAKRGQDMRADVPVVGVDTLERVLGAGLGGIAIEAGRTIVANRAQLLRQADRAGAFVVAL